jgi:aminomethyltransferase
LHPRRRRLDPQCVLIRKKKPVSDSVTMNETQLKQTPLFDLHQRLGATMVPFAGYQMPVRYAAGILSEHLHTRSAAGLFDVSHMGTIRVEGGADLYASFERLVPGDILGLQPGTVRYSLLLNKRSGIIDDLMVMRPACDTDRSKLMLIVNAGGKGRDFEHLRSNLKGGATVELLQDTALLALQGPKAAAILSRYCEAPGRLKFMQCGEYALAGFGTCIVSRTGYTGEDGFEISLPAAQAEPFARALLADPEVKMIGLGARDSLRLEAGLPLYGHDLDETITPVDASLGWVVGKRRRVEGGFPGFSIVRHELKEGPTRKRVGIRPQGKAIAREGVEIQSGGRSVGVVTSGGFGPSVSGPIALGYIQTAFAATGTPVDLIVRGKVVPGQVADLPFVAHRYAR